MFNNNFVAKNSETACCLLCLNKVLDIQLESYISLILGLKIKSSNNVNQCTGGSKCDEFEETQPFPRSRTCNFCLGTFHLIQ